MPLHHIRRQARQLLELLLVAVAVAVEDEDPGLLVVVGVLAVLHRQHRPLLFRFGVRLDLRVGLLLYKTLSRHSARTQTSNC